MNASARLRPEFARMPVDGEFQLHWRQVQCRLESFFRKRLGEGTDSEDALQRTAFGAWSGFDSLRDRARFAAWVFGIADHELKRVIRERMRGRARTTPIEDVVQQLEAPVREAAEAQTGAAGASWLGAAVEAAAARARLAGVDPLTDFEHAMFVAHILHPASAVRVAGWMSALTSACTKVFRELLCGT